MDINQTDTRLQELRAALTHLPSTTTTTSVQTDTSSGNIHLDDFWSELDVQAIPALTTLDLSALTANSALYTGTGANNFTMSHTLGGGGGGGSGGISYGYVHPSTTTGTSAIWNGTGLGSAGQGVMEIRAEDVVVKGRSLMATLDRIEQRLAILDCDESLEQHWQELRELGDQYRQLLQHIQDKMKTFDTLKK